MASAGLTLTALTQESKIGDEFPFASPFGCKIMQNRQQKKSESYHFQTKMVEVRRIELLSKQSPTRQRLQLFPSSYPKVSDGNKNPFGLAIGVSR